MEPECNQLIQENLSKNLADNDEYPAMLHLHQRCVSMLGNLWGAGATGQTGGTGEKCLVHMPIRWHPCPGKPAFASHPRKENDREEGCPLLCGSFVNTISGCWRAAAAQRVLNFILACLSRLPPNATGEKHRCTLAPRHHRPPTEKLE